MKIKSMLCLLVLMISHAAFAGVTDIRDWINRLPFSVSVVNGENTDNSFSLNVAEAKEHSVWIPWVFNQGDMWKSIRVLGDQKVLYTIFQSGNTVWWSRDSQKNHARPVPGDSSVNGRRTVTLTVDGPFVQKW
jgi:hypothetical protein